MKAVLKTKRLGMNTEEDVFLSPKAFWDATLQHDLDASLEREFSQQNRPEPCNTLVVVSVSKRAERDLTKEFVGLDIDWSLIGEKLGSPYINTARLSSQCLHKIREKVCIMLVADRRSCLLRGN